MKISNLRRRSFMAITAAGIAAAQAPSAAPKSFEVASIKPMPPGDNRVRVEMNPGGRFTFTNINVAFLMQQAFDARPFQIVGGPGWMTADRFEIKAKAEGEVSREQIKPLLQSLLEERFKLKFHKETKEAPIYHLVVGKNGHKMKPGEHGQSMMRMGRGQINANGVTMQMLSTNLSNILGRTVLDKTELEGGFNVELNWTPDETQAGGGPSGPPSGGQPPPPPPSDGTGPTLFTAVQEQLGLKLESTKGPVPMFVIDHIEKPTEN